MSPQRIQRRRTKGWRMPEGAIYVGRPSLWGNPWTPRDAPSLIPAGWDDSGLPMQPFREATWADRMAWCVAKYRDELAHFGLLSDYAYLVSDETWDRIDAGIIRSGAQSMADAAPLLLRGHDLACWCPLDQPCHADVLLELANQ